MAKQNRAKFGYLLEAEIQSRIDSGELNAFDVVFTKDSKKIILLSDSLELIEMRNRVYCFDNTSDAYAALNENEDSYEGQIISIKDENVYKAYVVNKNYAGKFYPVPLSASIEDVDYNDLGNRPITRLTGTLDNPIMVESLNSGIYMIDGQYRISEGLETVFLSSVSNLFLVEKDTSKIVIKKISAAETITYTIIDGVVTISTVATTDLLKNYATTEYVTSQISALEILTKEDVEGYVTDFINQSLDTLVESKIEEKLADGIDEIVDAKIDEKIGSVGDNSISDLFS